MKRKKPGDFIIKNTLLTIRYWSQSYTTALFNKKVQNYTVICQYSLPNFNLDILKDITAAHVYLNIDGDVNIARINAFNANVVPESITLHLGVNNLRLKNSWDMEWSTPEVIYEQILADKNFFKFGGKKLEEFVRPLGLIRKVSETDQALRRRTLSYINYQMDKSPAGDEVDLLIKKNREEGAQE